jgi:hypothetical protein
MKSLYRTQNRVFISLFLFFLLACNATVAVEYPTPTISAPAETAIATSPPLLLSQQATMISVPFQEDNPGPGFAPYKIAAQTPQLTGSDDPRMAAFNQRLNELVTQGVDMWRQSFQQAPVTPNSNGSSLNVTYTLISQVGDLWSFKFDFDFYSDGAAHPGLTSVTLNYDLGQGRELALSDLFLPNSNYLEAISNYCLSELRKQPYSDSFFLDGAKPTPENYRNWNIAPDGLVITFDEYQVAPYAAGPQKIVVPYSALTSVINPQGPLAVVVH